MADETMIQGRPNRSAQKRDARAVEALARQLAELPEASFNHLPATEELREEILLARRTTAHGARKRQIKHLAALLRQRQEVAAELGAFVASLQRQQQVETEGFHRIEQLRDRLCQPATFAAALTEAKRDFPGLPEATISALARSVHHSGDRAAARKLFRLLRQTAEAVPGDSEAGE